MSRVDARAPSIFVGLLFASVAWATDWSAIPARDNRGTVLIRTSWVDGSVQDQGTGTGFVVDAEGTIVTVAHQFPASLTAIVLYSGETEGWASDYPRQTFGLRLAKIDRLADIAILVPTKPVNLTPVPTSWDWQPKEGQEVHIRGFPLGGGLEGMSGTVRRSELSPTVPTSTLLRAGYSGGPLYNSSGRVVGMARGGTAVANVRNDPTLMGLGFFVPLSLLKDKVPTGLLASSAAPLAGSVSSAKTTVLRMSYPVDETKETLATCNPLNDLFKPPVSRQYTIGPIDAQPGYRIAEHQLQEHSATKVSDKDYVLGPGGSSITFTFKLTSGPPCDRWRGWLTATLVTIQVPKE